MDNTTEKRRKFIINFVFFAIIAVILYFVFNYLIGWLLPFIIGFIIAYLLNPLINWILSHTFIKSRKFLAYFLTVSIAIIIGLLISLLVYWAGSFIVDNIHYLPDFFQEKIQPQLLTLNSWLNGIINDLPLNLKSEISNIQTQLLVELQNLVIDISKAGAGYLTDLTTRIPAMFLLFIFTILATVFSNIDYPLIRNFILKTVPEKFSILAINIKVAFVQTVGRYIKAYAKIMSITFIELLIGLRILNIPNFVLVAFFIALFDILPVLGAGGVLIPWFIFSFISGNIQLGVGILIMYVVITMIRHFIEPKIVGDQLELIPLITLLSIYLGFIWFGVAGMLIIPIATNIVIKLYQKGQLKAFVNFEKVDFNTNNDKNKNSKNKPKKKIRYKKKK